MSVLQIAFGIAAAVAMLAIMCYSARRARPHDRQLGPVHRYYDVHVWGGVLFGVLVLCHTAFRFPRAPFGIVLWTLSLWVVSTGLLGWFLQWAVPKVLATAPFEVNHQRIPELVAELHARAERTVESAGSALRSFYAQHIAARLVAPRMSALAVVGGERVDVRPIVALRRTLDARDTAALDALVEIQAAKRNIDVQFTLQRVLHAWLWIHLPAAVALFGLVALHVFFSVYY